jgi:tRNA(adenine34) deaminase
MFDNDFMKHAIKMAEKAFSLDEIPVGAVVVDPKDNKIIAKAHNLVESNKNPTSHAEMLVLQKAYKLSGSKYLNGLDLYVTLQPCPMCLQAIIYSKIRRVYFGAYDHSLPILPLNNNHHLEIYGGIEEKKCKDLLDNFFAKKREL